MRDESHDEMVHLFATFIVSCAFSCRYVGDYFIQTVWNKRRFD